MNITDGIWRNSHAWPDRVAIIQNGQPLAYGALRQVANVAAARLAKAGVKRGDCVTIVGATPFAYITFVLAIARMGAVASGFHLRTPTAVREALLRRHEVKWLIQEASDTWRSAHLPDGAWLDMQKLLAPLGAGERLVAAQVARDADDEAWHIALSSGTTGTPKSIAQTHARSLLINAVGRGVPPTPQRVLVVADVAGAMGLGNAMRGLLLGSTVIVAPASDPIELLRVIEDCRVTRLVTSTAIAGQLVAYVQKNVPDSREICRSLEVVAIAGAAAPRALRQGLMERICPRLEINYGSTEAGPMATATTETLAVRPQSAGRIHYWVDAQAVDENDQPLPAGEQGVLRFKSATNADGYVGDPETTARAFRDGWYYPGDTGSIDKGGYLTLGGRIDHLINLGGKKLDPTLIETVIDSHPAVAESIVVAGRRNGGLTSELVAAVVLASPVEADELIALCREKLAAGHVPKALVFMDALPKNAGGKVMRAELAARLKVSRKDEIEE